MLRAVRATTRHLWTWAPYVLVSAVALFARLFPVLHSAGLKGVAGYDDGVYIAGSQAVVHGRVPYRDFVLLHPPALLYLLTPFALLAHWTGDANAWAAARVFAMLIGVLSTVLVALILRPYGTLAALSGSLLYAVWFPAINAEFSTLLEGPSNAALLIALLLLTRRARAENEVDRLSVGWPEVAAGAALGFALSMKIWGVVPCLIVVVWQLVTRGRRAAMWVLFSSAAMATVVCGPTFILAPGRMWELVVQDQLQRAASSTSPVLRAANFTPVSQLLPGATTSITVVGVLALGALGVVCTVSAWTVPSARIFVVLLLVHTAVLLGSPSYFPHYGAFTAPGVALTTGVGVSVLADRFRGKARGAAPVLTAALLAGFVVLVVPVVRVPRTSPFDASAVRAALAGRRCVAADTPGALVLAGHLSSDLARGCQTRIDVTGSTYNDDHAVGPHGRTLSRDLNLKWQKDLLSYLLSGNAAMVSRAGGDGLSPQTRQALHRLRVLYRGPGVTVYATTSG